MKCRINKTSDVYHQEVYENKIITLDFEFNNIEKEIDEIKLINTLSKFFKENKNLKDSFVGINIKNKKINPYIYNDQLNIDLKEKNE